MTPEQKNLESVAAALAAVDDKLVNVQERLMALEARLAALEALVNSSLRQAGPPPGLAERLKALGKGEEL
jgi:hypothetical protein